MITILHRGDMPKWLQYYIGGGYAQMITILHGGGVSRDPKKWLRNMCMTPNLVWYVFPFLLFFDVRCYFPLLAFLPSTSNIVTLQCTREPFSGTWSIDGNRIIASYTMMAIAIQAMMANLTSHPNPQLLHFFLLPIVPFFKKDFLLLDLFFTRKSTYLYIFYQYPKQGPCLSGLWG